MEKQLFLNAPPSTRGVHSSAHVAPPASWRCPGPLPAPAELCASAGLETPLSAAFEWEMAGWQAAQTHRR